MTNRRSHFVPWRSAGSITETDINSDEIVRETGWVFNNKTGDSLTLESFVKTGESEVKRYMHQFGFTPEQLAVSTLLEIGSGIGRMTSAFTQKCAKVIAADVDAAFLERCRETVGTHGNINRLQTLYVADGKTLQLADDSVDIAFSYITLQHCDHDDALRLTREAVRVTRADGSIALNYRFNVSSDIFLRPLGLLVRQLWRVPVIGKRLSLWRWATRLGWQANRLRPDEVFDYLRGTDGSSPLCEVRVFHSPRRALKIREVSITTMPLKRVNLSHWWLVAKIK
jgi:SAM-dependent methyltransferase